MNIEDVLSGKININDKGVKRWKYLEDFKHPRYLTKEELEDLFNSYIKEFENIIEEF